MLTVPQELAYDLADDRRVFRNGIVEVGSHAFRVALGTTAGQKVYDGPEGINEDACAVGIETGRFGEQTLQVLACDGASSFVPIDDLGDETGAHFASHTSVETFLNSPELSPKDLLVRLNRCLRQRLQQFRDVNLYNADTLPTTTALAIEIDPITNRLDVADVGDGLVVVQYDDNPSTTEVLNHNIHTGLDEGIFRRMEELVATEGITPLEARTDPRIVAATRLMLRRSRNTFEGIINGDPRAEDLVHATSTTRPIRQFYVATDGGIPPSLNEHNARDRQTLFHILKTEGVAGVIERTHAELDADPTGERFMRYKHRDDATGIYGQRVA
jgi:hypothetical protein